MLTVPQIAAMTGRSRRTIIRWFENEPDIFIMGNPETMHKRRYRTLRIPRAVFERLVAGRVLIPHREGEQIEKAPEILA
jgi:hypothetical protein